MKTRKSYLIDNNPNGHLLNDLFKMCCLSRGWI